jgi:hypothetical protein
MTKFPAAHPLNRLKQTFAIVAITGLSGAATEAIARHNDARDADKWAACVVIAEVGAASLWRRRRP